MALNYIREINAFYDWLETNSISNSAIVLWHALMHINNKAGWITEFTVAISTLETKTGLKKDAVLRARNRLQQVGRIAFKSRQGQQSAIYSIIPFLDSSSGCVVLNDTNCDTNRNTNRELTATLTATQTASINKLNINETKLEEINAPLLLPPGITDAEREILNKLKAVSGYPFDYAKDLEFIRELAVDYPAIDILEQVKKYAVWLLDNPYKAKSNPRLQFRNWCKNSVKWADKKTFEPVRGGKKQTIEEKLRVLEGY
jgi:hypothetical protein